jgi:hypothetical protein
MEPIDLRLRPFVPDDDAEVTGWFADAGELRFFAGKRLKWPLDSVQWDGIRSDPTLTACTHSGQEQQFAHGPAAQEIVWRSFGIPLRRVARSEDGPACDTL